MVCVGGYSVLETVGRGSYSEVKKVREQSTGAIYVAKIVPKTQASAQQQVDAEIRALSRLSHNRVIGLKEVLRSSNNYYIILEAASGGDLCDRVVIRDGGKVEGLPLSEIYRIFPQIVEGLMACHAAGVAHRDLKPDNVLLTDKGEAKISDFGLCHLRPSTAKVGDGPDYATGKVGTLVYVAPEVLTGHYDPFKADIWSLGCMLYVLATGCFPFPVRDRSKHHQRLHQPMDPLPKNTPVELRDLLSKLLTVDPRKRITLADVLKHPFVTHVSDRKVSCVVESTAARSARIY